MSQNFSKVGVEELFAVTAYENLLLFPLCEVAKPQHGICRNIIRDVEPFGGLFPKRFPFVPVEIEQFILLARNNIIVVIARNDEDTVDILVGVYPEHQIPVSDLVVCPRQYVSVI